LSIFTTDIYNVCVLLL